MNWPRTVTCCPRALVTAIFPCRDHSLPASRQQMRDVQRALAEAMRERCCLCPLPRRHRAHGHRSGLLPARTAANRPSVRSVSSTVAVAAECARRKLAHHSRNRGPGTVFVRDWDVGGETGSQRRAIAAACSDLAIGDALAMQPLHEQRQVAWTDDTGTTLCVADSPARPAAASTVSDQLDRDSASWASRSASGRRSRRRPQLRPAIAQCAYACAL